MTVAAGEAERRELAGTFEQLCRIASPSGHERECAAWVAGELRAIGLEVYEDGAGAQAGSDSGNLLVRIPARAQGAGARPSRAPLLLCAHLDTVPLTAPVEPVLVDGRWENARPGILGADNKAAVAVILGVARRAVRDGLPVELELLFTVAEERSLAGARAFDASLLRSEVGYVFDHATPIGQVVVASPSHYRLEATFHGAAAHAGLAPEQGRNAIAAAARAVSAMRLGRLDDVTTANIGTIEGGTALNVVPERCMIVGEARSHDDAAVETLVAEMVECCHDAANLPECECDVDVVVERLFTGYRVSASDPALLMAEQALLACGFTPTRVASGGGSDANELQAKGKRVINVANGTERPHEPGERVSVAALESMLDVALALPHLAAA